jgi:hypothetical protein
MPTSIPCLQNTDSTESICNDVGTLGLATMVKSLMNVSWNTIHERFDIFPTRRHGQEEILELEGERILPSIINTRRKAFKDNIGNTTATATLGWWYDSHLVHSATRNPLSGISCISPARTLEINRQQIATEARTTYHVSLTPVRLPEETL